MTRLDAAAVHSALGASGWTAVLQRLGVPESALRNRHGPCPAPDCGGKDRFRYDNRLARGDWICNVCGSGDGFKLLQRLHGWDFREAIKRVAEAAGISPLDDCRPLPAMSPARHLTDEPARPTPRALELLRTACDPAAVSDVREYLASRSLWPLPAGCALRAHAAAPYYVEKACIGRFPALIAPVVDADGELVTLHLTWLKGGKKIEDHEPRKILGKLTARRGCAVRLTQPADALGIAEGTETALAAAKLHELPVWAALNAPLLAKFEPPECVRRLIVFADRDVPGLDAASKLLVRLQGQIRVEICTPPAPLKDWNDVLRERPQ